MIPILFQGAAELAKTLVGDWSDRKREQTEIRKAKVQAEIERIQAGEQHAADLDLASIKSRGLKDDIFFLLLLAPVVMTFIPETRDYAAHGFVALEDMPEWYIGCIALLFVDTFGFRRMLRGVIEAWASKRIGDISRGNNKGPS